MNTKGDKLRICILFLIFTSCLFFFSHPVSASHDSSKVLFDESAPYPGKFFTINNIGPFGASGFATLLQENGYSVSRTTDRPLTSEKLQGYDVLVVMGNFRNYTADEVTAIKDFVNNGGGLLLVATSWGDVDGDQNFGFNKIAHSFGVSFANNEIVTDNSHYIFFKNFVL
ncbi:MAG TPA: DUF4350 domain-containing protein, partial [Methanobacterium sp.]|nr:DUF4350 domain-containing protein [Methanobacterium sp.]